MTPMQCVKAVGAATAIGVLLGIVISSGPVRAWDDDHDEDARVSQGFKIAPVVSDKAGAYKSVRKRYSPAGRNPRRKVPSGGGSKNGPQPYVAARLQRNNERSLQ